MADPPDRLGELQKKLLELSEVMYNGLGLVQRNAPPRALVEGSDAGGVERVPASVQGAEEQWRAAVALQQQAWCDFACAVVTTSKAIDALAPALEVPTAAPGDAEQRQVEEALQVQLTRAAGLLKRVRALNAEVMDQGLPRKKRGGEA